MRRNGMTLPEVLGVLVVLFGVWWILWPIGHPGAARRARERHECQSNLKQIALAIAQYTQDFSERYPSLRTMGGWRGAIAPYLKNDAVFHCPSEGDDKTAQYCDYWFNARLSEIGAEKLSDSAHIFLLGDGYSSGDPRSTLSQLPQSWGDDDKSPAWRHLDGANYAFADGHVKWFQPKRLSEKMGGKLNFTFAVR